ncbi:MAG: hypothetical protein F4Z41_09480 [Acidimicrobiia bacterium]|nr:hypothetical protein [Acidimicrobiia bacterium]MXX46412.1 hypothetical protein [Acidimicrobiia bacterium]MYA40130.1 hypothetical protein [Acidimicrobiia bacterium]MYD40440.1 hypothetical protein [Acidimicrobiia bacterium]MYH06960.1 hypothetical protein [Acidimicrobiia bacterium]
MREVSRPDKPKGLSNEEAGDGLMVPSKTGIFGWSSEIVIGDLTDPAIPPEDWHIVSDPDRVLGEAN